MAVRGRSAKGVVVDFDLLRIKEEMAAAPTSIDVQKRQDFIENRMRRRARKKVPQELLNKIPEVEVEKEMPAVEGEAAELVVEEKAAPTPKKSRTRQKARPKAKTEE